MRRAALALVLLGLVGCGNNNANGGDAGPATCGAPGMPTSGAADTHCGATVQPTSQASCGGEPDTGVAPEDTGIADVDAGVPVCEYGTALFGSEGDDDDCKYHFAFATTPICEGSAGVFFTVTLTSKVDGSAVTGADMRAETFVPGGTGCDDIPSHVGPNTFAHLHEGPPGRYSGAIVFDQAAEWNVRFHVFESCDDVPEESPHGHVAFRITVP